MSKKVIVNFKATRLLKDAINIVAAKESGGNTSKWLENLTSSDPSVLRELRALKRNATPLQK